MTALCFGGHCHQQRSGATSQIRHAEGRWELVISPVDALRPSLEHQARQHRRRRHRGVVGASELGVGQEGVKQAARQVMSLQSAGVLHRLN